MNQRIGLQFRAEAFNVFNSVNFRLPNNNLSSAQFGQITQVVENNQRIIQLGLKVLFLRNAMKNTTAILLLSCLLLSVTFPSAQEARDTVRAVVARNAIPAQDARNTVLSSRTHYKMPAFATREAWQERAAFLRKQILASAGLLPMPEKRPLNAQVFGKLERQGYSVEKVLLETLPGFYLGGNLYRPLGQQGPFPGVVSPHGHWAVRPAGEHGAGLRSRAGDEHGPAGLRGFHLRHGRPERHRPDPSPLE